MPWIPFLMACLMAAVTLDAAEAETGSFYLDELDLRLTRQGWGEPQARKSIEQRPLRLHGQRYERGVGFRAPATLYIELDGQTSRFQATAGIDDETQGRGSAAILAYGDGKRLFKSPWLNGGQPPVIIDLDLTGIRQLTLLLRENLNQESFDHVDLAQGEFRYTGSPPKLVDRPSFFQSERILRTPKPPTQPQINGPRISGVRPGAPFLFRIPATGQRPMTFAVKGLPDGLSLDPNTGIISGTIANQSPQKHQLTLTAENRAGNTARPFQIVTGPTIALTPPMGWNHWYAHYDRITDDIIRHAADIMETSGMAAAGYQYICIDDCWMNRPEHPDPKRAGPLRGPDGALLPNAYFPDMTALTAYIHAKGLKTGIYSSPGPFTCGGYAGSWNHETQDAALFAQWGFDFLKYDWCSYSYQAKDKSLHELQKPYRKMAAILKSIHRDILFNLCQYGMGEVWTWAPQIGANTWRTDEDLGFSLREYHRIARRNATLHPYAKPGAWNDPDYLMLGYTGNPAHYGPPAPCPLSPNEQFSYMSLWCLMAAPLFFSGDMAALDEFTLNVLCNPEVIEIDQDPLGKQGRPILYRHDENIEIWTKPLEDAAFAVGLFNLCEGPQEITVRWEEIGLTGIQHVRDLWRQSDLGTFNSAFAATVGRHDVMLLRCRPTE